MKWEEWRTGVFSIRDVTFPRCIKPAGFGDIVNQELHHFADASQAGYGIMYSQFGVGPLLYLCCSSHVLLLYVFCPPLVPLMCSCFTSLVPLVPPFLFLSSSTVHLPFTWGHWEDLKRPFEGTLLSLFCSSKPNKTTLIWPNSHLLIEFSWERPRCFGTLI